MHGELYRNVQVNKYSLFSVKPSWVIQVLVYRFSGLTPCAKLNVDMLLHVIA